MGEERTWNYWPPFINLPTMISCYAEKEIKKSLVLPKRTAVTATVGFEKNKWRDVFEITKFKK
jgi:hypothetical protein